jgi:hypothetical protein
LVVLYDTYRRCIVAEGTKLEDRAAAVGAAVGRVGDAAVDWLKEKVSHKVVVRDGDQVLAEIGVPVESVLELVRGSATAVQRIKDRVNGLRLEIVSVNEDKK